MLARDFAAVLGELEPHLPLSDLLEKWIDSSLGDGGFRSALILLAIYRVEPTKIMAGTALRYHKYGAELLAQKHGFG